MKNSKNIYLVMLFVISLSACATSGTSVGNGLVQKPIESKTSPPKTFEELCSVKNGKVLTVKTKSGAEEVVCDLGSGKTKTYDELKKD